MNWHERLLDVWERGQELPAPGRAECLLAALDEQIPANAAWTVGRRDQALFALRQRLFGERMQVVATCPQCTTPASVSLGITEVLSAAPAESVEHEQLTPLEFGEYRIAWRLPRASDLRELHVLPANKLREQLLARCLLEIRRQETVVSVRECPEEVVAQVCAAMSAADPLADVRLAIRCPDCNHEWEALLDIVSFLWRELHGWAMRTLSEIHVLARAYGWSEREILALTPWRRQRYLELVGA